MPRKKLQPEHTYRHGELCPACWEGREGEERNIECLYAPVTDEEAELVRQLPKRPNWGETPKPCAGCGKTVFHCKTVENLVTGKQDPYCTDCWESAVRTYDARERMLRIAALLYPNLSKAVN
jgi:hypothetical protein